MATQSTTKTGKRGRPRLKITKARPSISMDPAILKAARKLAFGEGLALSTWLERIVRERLIPTTGADS